MPPCLRNTKASSSGTGGEKDMGRGLDYQKLPSKYLKKNEPQASLLTNYYQGIFLSKSFAAELNVVIIEKINVQSGKLAHAVFFSSDLDLSWEKIVEYYSLRFQIEFNFRAAKQHFALGRFYDNY